MDGGYIIRIFLADRLSLRFHHAFTEDFD